MSFNPNAPYIIPVNKPEDVTSARLVSIIKKKLGKSVKKIGHFGTLDPFASGLMLVGFNGSMRLMNYVQEYGAKTYLATGILGRGTTTGDTEGEVTVEDAQLSSFSSDHMKYVLGQFLGEYWQRPHAFSASKFEGRPLYEYARSGESIQKDAVQRFVYQIDLIRYEHPRVVFQVKVSSGTYIRVLFENIAEKLGTSGHLQGLERLEIGGVNLEQAIGLAELENSQNLMAEYGNKFLSPQELFPVSQLIVTDEAVLKKLLNGLAIPWSSISSSVFVDNPLPYYWLVNQRNQLIIGLYQLVNEVFVPEFLLDVSAH